MDRVPNIVQYMTAGGELLITLVLVYLLIKVGKFIEAMAEVVKKGE